MDIIFYISAAVAVITTFMVITRLNAMHALLYLIVSLLAVAMMFITLGAPFVGMLEIVVYAGAIMVLVLFAIMLLNLGPTSVARESRLLSPKIWVIPSILTALLLAELIYVLSGSGQTAGLNYIGPVKVGISLLSQYLLGVELASFLLLSGMIGAYHLGRKDFYKREPGQAIEAGEPVTRREVVEVWHGSAQPAEQEQAPVFQPNYTGQNAEESREGGED